MNNVMKENHSKYEQLLQPNSNIVKILRSLYNGETPASPFTSTPITGSASNPSSLFRSAIQNTSVFNQTPSVFSQNTNTPNSQSVFTQNNSIFGPQSNQNGFNQNVFPQPSETPVAKSIFAQASQNIFGPQTTQNENVFDTKTSSSIFATANQSLFGPKETQTFPNQNQTMNVFQKSDPSKVVPNIFQQAAVTDNEIYSKMEDLQEDDLEMYRSDEFVLGFVPEMPPPHSLCF